VNEQRKEQNKSKHNFLAEIPISQTINQLDIIIVVEFVKDIVKNFNKLEKSEDLHPLHVP